ncbi:hypothetical protein ACFV0R_11345 [Streptomyces sp. NPDC059578]|uniref:hypothetical protein n=1 Tax=Streptomyces sp. NPDC059578 TaxID=3346874 RepID=UPI0036B22746
MPTAIAVTSPDLVLPALDRHTPSAAVLRSAAPAERSRGERSRGERAAGKSARQGRPPDAYGLEQSLTEMHTLIEHHGHVVVVCPASAPPAVVRRLHTVRSLLETDRIALLRPDLPPLGLAVLTLQLRQLSMCDFSPGVLASAARLLAHYIYAGALLGSVARLDRVPVDLKTHTRSWVPGSQFAVLATPQSELVRLTGARGAPHGPAADGEAPALTGPAFGTHLFTAAGQLAPDWVTDTLAPAWRVQGVTETRLPAESPHWWATGKVVEFAAAIPDISVLYQLVSSVRREHCRWCGLELIGDRCGFCSAPLAPAPEATGSPRTATTRAAPALRRPTAARALTGGPV